LLDAKLIIDPPAAGAWNMSVDEALLHWANETEQVTLRIYQWAEPTLSLGYFQKFDDRGLHPASVDCEIVRRSSGGGAIVHDRELTYSLSLPGTNRWSSKQNDLYGSVHSAIVGFLNESGVSAEQYVTSNNSGESVAHKNDKISSAGDRHKFLCFERRTAGDIVLKGFKIGGSAQRRLSGATLQHGSLLLKRSEFAPELPGISDLADLDCSQSEILEGMINAMAVGLDLSLSMANLSAQQKENAENILEQKYGNSGWTSRR